MCPVIATGATACCFFQIILSTYLFWGDGKDLGANLFIQGANNERLILLRAVCMVTVAVSSYPQFIRSLKKISVHYIVNLGANPKYPAIYYYVYVISFVDLFSQALMAMVSFVIISSSDDKDGAIGIISAFTSVAIVGQVDDAMAPFVLEFIGALTGEIDLYSEAVNFVKEIELSKREQKNMVEWEEKRWHFIRICTIISAFLVGLGLFGCLGGYNACNLLVADYPNDSYQYRFFPKICSNDTNYCKYNSKMNWVHFKDTNCADSNVDTAAAYFVRLNSTASENTTN